MMGARSIRLHFRPPSDFVYNSSKAQTDTWHLGSSRRTRKAKQSQTYHHLERLNRPAEVEKYGSGKTGESGKTLKNHPKKQRKSKKLAHFS